MPRKKNSRTGNGESSIYLGSDGSWHGRITIGLKDNGDPDRRHRRGKTRAAVVKKIKELEKQRATAMVPEAGVSWTVGEWLDHWVENIAKPSVRENSYAGYEVDVRIHLKPAIGGQKLDKLMPEHLERLYTKMQTNGSSPATANHAHRTIRTALGEAERRGYLTRTNPAALAKAPRLDEEEDVDPFTVEEVQRLMLAAVSRRNSTRWAIALALGLRQGEALGLKWVDIDFDAGAIRVKRGRQRPKWKHGCAGDCGRKFGGYCPDRVPLRSETAPTKSRAGRRTIGIPDQLLKLLEHHREKQDTERTAAGTLWTEKGYVFTSPTGEPLHPRTDYGEWKRILEAAELRDAPLHGARHTAATVLLLLGVPDRAVMGLMGWTKAEMLARYQHLTDAVRSDIAGRVGDLLWDKAAPEPTDTNETGKETT
jgi:integrase